MKRWLKFQAFKQSIVDVHHTQRPRDMMGVAPAGFPSDLLAALSACIAVYLVSDCTHAHLVDQPDRKVNYKNLRPGGTVLQQ